MISNLTNINLSNEYYYNSLISSSEFEGMFEYCTSLVTMPDINTIIFGDKSCKKMFYNCISLRNVKNINLLTYSNESFESMFENCISLISTPSFDYHNIDLNEYFTEYPKEKYLFSNYLDNIINDYQNYLDEHQELSDGQPSILEVLFYELLNNPYYKKNTKVFYSTFYNCNSLKNINNIYIAYLSDYCFGLTFTNCTSLEQINNFLHYNFNRYNNRYAFGRIFYNCSSLRIVPKDFFISIPSNIGSSYHNYLYISAFENCISLIQAPNIISESTILNSYESTGLCQRMFANCTSLIESPELIFLQINRNSGYEPSIFEEMFYNCSSLNTIYTNISYDLNNTDGFNNWVYGVASTGIFYLNFDYPDWEERGSSFIPEGWNISYKGLHLLNNEKYISLSSDGDTYNLEIYCSNSFSIKSSPEFVNITTIDNGNNYYTLKIEAGSTEENRIGNLILLDNLSNNELEISIRQLSINTIE